MLREIGISTEAVSEQLRMFSDGVRYRAVVRPATVGDGIAALSPERQSILVDRFESRRPSLRIRKFVPASGAASRMFAALDRTQRSIERGFGADVAAFDARDPDAREAQAVLRDVSKLAVYDDLVRVMRRDGLDVVRAMEQGEFASVISYLLTPRGLGLLDRPKALVPFHRYPEGSRTAFEEHIVEAAAYARGADGTARAVFTVSPEHAPLFEAAWSELKTAPRWRPDRLDVTFTFQKSSTNTVAVDKDGRLVRDRSGGLVLRAGGHGALIENVADLDAELVFVKTVDNVAMEHRADISHRWKRVLGGLLLEVEEETFAFLDELSSAAALSPDRVAATSAFLRRTFGAGLPVGFDELPIERQRTMLFERLHRPLRVCGMVKNQGEPGGGPFWVRSGEEVTLQIVEGSEIDRSDPASAEALAASTHFNPVDLVLGILDHRGAKYDLLRYVDRGTYFISEKTLEGRPLRALELPGLWNGAMAHWNTVFVEVPSETFSPVKKIVDLLRPEHV